jgi:glycerol-3-phosphate dehydrogenase
MRIGREPREEYDLAIVGGGIYGCAALWEAASRGIHAALFEASDFCSGTSANSLKIIHGGIRYLKSFDFSRVRASSREQTILLRRAPHLVAPLECVMPTYPSLIRSRPALWAALRIYDLTRVRHEPALGAVPDRNRSELISPHELDRALGFPLPEANGGLRWYDAQVYNSERLALAFIQSALGRGADAFNYLAVRELVQQNGRVEGLAIEDRLNGSKRNTRVAAMLDCTGPWASREPLVKPAPHSQQFLRAMNLVVRRQWTSSAVGLPMPDEPDRLLFLAPWRDGTIIGTWYYPNDTEFDQRSTVVDAVNQLNRAIPTARLRLHDVTLVHEGLLPAYASRPSAALQLEERDQIFAASERGHVRGLFSVQGVKYTMARHVAAKAIDEVARYLGKGDRSRTGDLPLVGGEMEDFDSFLATARQRYSHSVPSDAIHRLTRNYGTNIERVMAYASRTKVLGEPVPGTQDTLRAEIEYALDNESTYTLSDLLFRRTDLGSLALPSNETIEYCLERMTTQYGWDGSQRDRNMAEVLAHYPDWAAGEEPTAEGSQAGAVR